MKTSLPMFFRVLVIGICLLASTNLNAQKKAFQCPDDFYYCTNDGEFELSSIYDWPEGGTFRISGNVVTIIQPVQYPDGTILEVNYHQKDQNITCDFKIYINDPPAVDCPGLRAFCYSFSTINISGLGYTPSGGVFSGDYITPEGVFDKIASGPGDFIITYTYTDPTTGCSSSCEHTIRFVNGEASIVLKKSEFCDNDEEKYEIQVSPQGGEVTGSGVSLDGDNYFFTPKDLNAGNYDLTYHYDYPIGNCDGWDRFAVTVKESPNANCPVDIYVCGPQTDPVELPIPAYEEWHYEGTAITQNTQEATFDPAQAGPGKHAIILTVWGENGCISTCLFSITVGDMEIICPDVKLLDFCLDYESTIPLSEQEFKPEGGTFSGDYVDENGNFNSKESGAGMFEISYTVTDEQNQCFLSCTTSVIIRNGEIECTDKEIVICENDSIHLPRYANCTPSGGTYKGIGVEGDYFYGSIAGPGTHEIVYHYEYEGCDGWCKFYITVLEAPEIQCPNDTTICDVQAEYPLPIPDFIEYQYSGNGVIYTNTPIFSAAKAGKGTHEIILTVWDDQTQCENSCIFYITVGGQVLECQQEHAQCFAFTYIPYGETSFFSPEGGIFSGDFTSPNGDFDMDTAGPGDYTITYTYTDPETGCESICEMELEIIAGRIKCPEESIRICLSIEEIDLDALYGTNPDSGIYYGDGVSDNHLITETAGIGVHELRYQQINEAACDGWCKFHVIIDELFEIECPKDTFLCGPGSDPIYFPVIDDTYFNYSGPGILSTTGGYFFDPAFAGPGEHEIKYIQGNKLNGCIDSCTFTITVGNLELICPNNENLRFSYFIGDGINLASLFSPSGGTFSGEYVTAEGYFDRETARPGIFDVTYAVIDETTGCEDSCEVEITITNRELTCPDDTLIVCSNDTINLAEAFNFDPSGGIFHGDGVVDKLFFPAIAGPSIHELVYQYDFEGSDGWCWFFIKVLEAPELECPNDTIICDVSSQFPLPLQTGWHYAGTGVTYPTGAGPIFDASVAGTGAHEITITVWDTDTICNNTCSFWISVGVSIDCPDTLTVCNNQTIDLTAEWNFNSAGVFSGDYVSADGMFNAPVWSDQNCFTVQYKLTGEEGCSDSCEFVVCLYPPQEIDCPNDRVVCESEYPIYITEGWSGYFTFNGDKFEKFFPTTPDDYEIWYHQMNPDNGCWDSCNFTIQVMAKPDISCPNDTTICKNGGPIDLFSIVPVSNYDTQWFTGPGTDGQHGQYFDPDKVQTGTYTIGCFASNEDCLDSCWFNITVLAVPCVLHCPDQPTVVCQNGMAINLNELAVYDCIDAQIGFENEIGVEYEAEHNIWYFDPGKVNFSAADTNIIISAWICYFFNNNADSCCQESEFKIKVIRETDITVVQDTLFVCSTAQTVNLSAAVEPQGGEMYMNGTLLTAGEPIPSQYPLGSHTIWYYYPSKELSCADSASFIMEILPPPTISLPSDTTLTNLQDLILNFCSFSGDVVKVEWSTSGSGSFNDPILQNPTYSSSGEDRYQNGFVMLYVTAMNKACNTSDSILVHFEEEWIFTVEDENDQEVYWFTISPYEYVIEIEDEDKSTSLYQDNKGNISFYQFIKPISESVQAVQTLTEFQQMNPEDGFIHDPINYNTGYIMNISEKCSLRIKSNITLPITVNLTEGWNLVPIKSPCDLDVSYFATKTNATIIKEVAGFKVYWPDKNISSLKTLKSKHAYMAYLPASINFEFPACDDMKSITTDDYVFPNIPEEWGNLRRTPGSEVIALPFDDFKNVNIADGDVIGAFSPESILGGACEIGINDALVLFANDVITSQKDGFAENDSITFKIYRKTKNKTENLIVDISKPNFAKNSYVVAQSVIVSGVSSNTTISYKIYPNPVTNKLTVVSLTSKSYCYIYNISGQLIHETMLNVGQNSIATHHFQPGVYIINIKSDNVEFKGNFIKQ